MLSELPDGVSGLANADRLAAELGQILAAAMVNDPMFGGTGVPVDPGLLLTPPEGKRARVSVINLVGLQSDEQRQSFVNQLQMALFAWIKKHPAGDRPLGGLFVMDEAQTFAPSGAMTACTRARWRWRPRPVSTGSVWCSRPRPRRGCTTRFRGTPRPSSSAC